MSKITGVDYQSIAKNNDMIRFTSVMITKVLFFHSLNSYCYTEKKTLDYAEKGRSNNDCLNDDNIWDFTVNSQKFNI